MFWNVNTIDIQYLASSLEKTILLRSSLQVKKYLHGLLLELAFLFHFHKILS